MDKGSKAGSIVETMRTRKGLKPDVPEYTNVSLFIDVSALKQELTFLL
jgi:hypothetical protein